jgi:hypothetical protein
MPERKEELAKSINGKKKEFLSGKFCDSLCRIISPKIKTFP